MSSALIMQLAFGIFTFLAILFLAYEALHESAEQYVKGLGGVSWGRPYPWWVRLDEWIYHKDYCRVGEFVYERQCFLGGHFNKIGDQAFPV